jgi:hypothetical protein
MSNSQIWSIETTNGPKTAMTKEEFISRQQSVEHYFTKLMLRLTAGFVVLVLCLIPLRIHLERDRWGRFKIWLICFVYFIVVGSIVGSVCKRRRKELGVLCPGCGKSFHRKADERIVIASGNCGHCGAKIIAG